MAGYISSNENRFYVCSEPEYGTSAAITAANRIPAVQLRASQRRDTAERKDKTGTRTYFGIPATSRCRTTYRLVTYMTTWGETSNEPCYGPLFRSALGGDAELSNGLAATSMNGELLFGQPHGLSPGQAIAYGGEIRFVAGVPNATSVVVNAPFTALGSDVTTPTATYRPKTSMTSFSLFDYWTPSTAVQRALSGAGVDEMVINVNGDYQQFEFSGESADLVDSSTFESGMAGLDQFPQEPPVAGFDQTIIPGHLGQVWIGSAPDRFYTLTSGVVRLSNGLELRAREFGSASARGMSGATRNVSVEFTLYAQDESATQALYQAGRQRSPVGVMFQLGEQEGQLCGLYMPSVTLEAPEFDDSETRLQWKFQGRAQGFGDDELFVAFA